MSLIGKTVKFYHADSNFIGKRNGVILDKYLGFTRNLVELPSGKGGTIAANNPVSIDKYIIQADNLLLHIECMYITEIVPEQT